MPVKWIHRHGANFDQDLVVIRNSLVEFGDIGDELLAYKPGSEVGIELAKQTTRHSVVPSCSSNAGHNTDAIRSQNPSPFGERMVPNKVKDQIIALVGLREVFFRVI